MKTIKRLLYSALLILACCMRLSAESHIFPASGMMLFAASAADMISTRSGINQGAIEANPILGQDLKRQALLSFGSAGATYAWTRSLRQDHPKTALAVRLGFIASRLLFSAHNLRVSR